MNSQAAGNNRESAKTMRAGFLALYFGGASLPFTGMVLHILIVEYIGFYLIPKGLFWALFPMGLAIALIAAIRISATISQRAWMSVAAVPILALSYGAGLLFAAMMMGIRQT